MTVYKLMENLNNLIAQLENTGNKKLSEEELVEILNDGVLNNYTKKCIFIHKGNEQNDYINIVKKLTNIERDIKSIKEKISMEQKVVAPNYNDLLKEIVKDNVKQVISSNFNGNFK